MRPGHFLDPVVGSSGRWGLRMARSGVRLACDATLAGTSASRRRGLAGRAAMAAGEALVIAPSQGIHTFGMRFPIDVVAVNRQGLVVRLSAEVGPRRIRLAWRAFAMIELPVGAIEAAAVRLGDVVEVVMDPIAAP